jgi:hypothetical protein
MTQEFELSDEQKEVLNRLIQAFEAVWDALLEMIQVLMERIRKTFEYLARAWTHLQLLEWRMPPLMAKFVSEKIPARLAFRIGYDWFMAKLSP